MTTAQVMAYGDVEEVPTEVVQRVVDTAVMGTHHLARHVLPVFRRQGGGTLVVVSSLLAEIAVPSMGIYSAAKWGQLGLVRAMQAETRHERGIHVCLVKPGAIDTPIYHQAASYAGSRGSAPPPVITPEAVATKCLAMLDRPRRASDAGPVNKLAVLGFRYLPFALRPHLRPAGRPGRPARSEAPRTAPATCSRPTPGARGSAAAGRPWAGCAAPTAGHAGAAVAEAAYGWVTGSLAPVGSRRRRSAVPGGPGRPAVQGGAVLRRVWGRGGGAGLDSSVASGA